MMAYEGGIGQKYPQNQSIGGEPQVEGKFDFQMINDELKEQIEECVDIFVKYKG